MPLGVGRSNPMHVYACITVCYVYTSIQSTSSPPPPAHLQPLRRELVARRQLEVRAV